MILEALAIGDAYGAGFEFEDPETVRLENKLCRYRANGDVGEGCYTDDTQLSLALAELMLGGGPWSHLTVADAFVRCYQRDPRPGYAPGFAELLASAENGAELLQHVNADSERNGAAMRAAPLGLLADIDELLRKARIQAEVTHNTEIGIKSAQAVALAMHYCCYRLGSIADLPAFVEQHSHFYWDAGWQAPVGCCGWETVNAVLSVLVRSSTLAEVLQHSVDLTGDVDTVAALALSIASTSGFYRQDLPDFLTTQLENRAYGRDYLRELDHRLLAGEFGRGNSAIMDVKKEDIDFITFPAHWQDPDKVCAGAAVRAYHRPSGITVESQDERSQHLNALVCMELLRVRLCQ